VCANVLKLEHFWCFSVSSGISAFVDARRRDELNGHRELASAVVYQWMLELFWSLRLSRPWERDIEKEREREFSNGPERLCNSCIFCLFPVSVSLRCFALFSSTAILMMFNDFEFKCLICKCFWERKYSKQWNCEILLHFKWTVL